MLKIVPNPWYSRHVLPRPFVWFNTIFCVLNIRNNPESSSLILSIFTASYAVIACNITSFLLRNISPFITLNHSLHIYICLYITIHPSLTHITYIFIYIYIYIILQNISSVFHNYRCTIIFRSLFLTSGESQKSSNAPFSNPRQRSRADERLDVNRCHQCIRSWHHNNSEITCIMIT